MGVWLLFPSHPAPTTALQGSRTDFAGAQGMLLFDPTVRAAKRRNCILPSRLMDVTYSAEWTNTISAMKTMLLTMLLFAFLPFQAAAYLGLADPALMFEEGCLDQLSTVLSASGEVRSLRCC